MDLLAMLTTRYGVNVDTTLMEPNPGFGLKNSTPLIRVVERGDELMARLLVQELGADPDHIIMSPGSQCECFWPEVGNTALLSAISNRNPSMVKLLVRDLGADINLHSPRHMRFHYNQGNLERSEVLLTYTPLLFAIEKEDPIMVVLILSLGADPLVRGWTRTQDDTFLCGNSLQLAEIRFEDREPTVIEFLREARERKQQTLNQNRREIRNDFEQNELLQRLETTSEKLKIHNRFLGNVKKHVECNICIDIPASTDKIFICQNSHIFCEWCVQRVVECPLCKVNFIFTRPIRNRLAESIIHDISALNLQD